MELFIDNERIGDYVVTLIVVEGEKRSENCYMEVRAVMANGHNVLRGGSGYYSNLLILSEALRDAIGYGLAYELLEKFNVPKESPLFKLGRKG